MKSLEDFVSKMTEFHKMNYELSIIAGEVSAKDYLKKSKEVVKHQIKELWPYQDEIIAITNGTALSSLALDVVVGSKPNCPHRQKIREKIEYAFSNIKWDKRTEKEKDSDDRDFNEWLDSDDEENND